MGGSEFARRAKAHMERTIQVRLVKQEIQLARQKAIMSLLAERERAWRRRRMFRVAKIVALLVGLVLLGVYFL